MIDIALATKLVLTASIVVTASKVTERAGALIGALVVTLPVTVWPAFLFLSLDHDTAFLAAAALTALAANSVTAIFMFVFVVVARRRGLAASLAAALVVWVGIVFAVRAVDWTYATAGLFSFFAFSTCILAARPYRYARMPPFAPRWYDVPLRTTLVCALMAAVLVIGSWAGPIATGIVAAFPISVTSTMLILFPRIGGLPTAAVVANGLWGVAGCAAGLAALHLSFEPLGKVPSLALGLGVPITWNLIVWLVNRYRAKLRTALLTR
jgi:hypothetical protein